MRVGDRVMLKRGSFYYRQAPGVVGEVTDIFGPEEKWTIVKWNQKELQGRPDEDNYPMDDLILATKLDKLLAGVDSEV